MRNCKVVGVLVCAILMTASCRGGGSSIVRGVKRGAQIISKPLKRAANIAAPDGVRPIRYVFPTKDVIPQVPPRTPEQLVEQINQAVFRTADTESRSSSEFTPQAAKEVAEIAGKEAIKGAGKEAIKKTVAAIEEIEEMLQPSHREKTFQPGLATRYRTCSMSTSGAPFNRETHYALNRAYSGLLAWLQGNQLDDASLAAYLVKLDDDGGAYTDAVMVVVAVYSSARLSCERIPIGERTAQMLYDRWLHRYEGSYVDGKRHGDWVIRSRSGSVYEGPYVDGKWHGDWVIRRADGSTLEGLYVDGKRHGDWVTRRADGSIWLTCRWENGKVVDGLRVSLPARPRCHHSPPPSPGRFRPRTVWELGGAPSRGLP